MYLLAHIWMQILLVSYSKHTITHLHPMQKKHHLLKKVQSLTMNLIWVPTHGACNELLVNNCY